MAFLGKEQDIALGILYQLMSRNGLTVCQKCNLYIGLAPELRILNQHFVELLTQLLDFRILGNGRCQHFIEGCMILFTIIFQLGIQIGNRLDIIIRNGDYTLQFLFIHIKVRICIHHTIRCTHLQLLLPGALQSGIPFHQLRFRAGQVQISPFHTDTVTTSGKHILYFISNIYGLCRTAGNHSGIQLVDTTLCGDIKMELYIMFLTINHFHFIFNIRSRS